MSDLQPSDRSVPRVAGEVDRPLGRQGRDLGAGSLARPRARRAGVAGAAESRRLAGVRLGPDPGPDGPAGVAEGRRRPGPPARGSLLRFSRPDGTPGDRSSMGRIAWATYRSILSACAGAFPRSPEARVIGWWLNRPDANPVPPPLPACSSTRRAARGLARELAEGRRHADRRSQAAGIDHPVRAHRPRPLLVGPGLDAVGRGRRPPRSPGP